MKWSWGRKQPRVSSTIRKPSYAPVVEALETRDMPAAGLLDLTFGGNPAAGRQLLDFGDNSTARAVAVQPDGKMLVAGTALITVGGVTDYDFALARFLPNGQLDTAFGERVAPGSSTRLGYVTTDFSGDDFAYGLAVQGNTIVVAGTVDSGTDFALACYDGSGDPVTAFGTNGKRTLDFDEGDDIALSVLIQPDGKIVVAGTALIGGGYNFALARLTPTGTLDTTFGNPNAGQPGQRTGTTTTHIAGNDYGAAVALQGSNIVVAGSADFGLYHFDPNFGFAPFLGSDADFAVARYEPDGDLDNTFDDNGLKRTDLGGNDLALAAVIQGNDIVVAGATNLRLNLILQTFTDSSLALVRYQLDGNDASGRAVANPTTGADVALAVAAEGNKVVAAGVSNLSLDGTSSNFFLARFDATGSADLSFSGDGMVTTDFAGDNDLALAVAIQANGQIVAAGGAVVSGQSNFALARYENDRVQFGDTTFQVNENAGPALIRLVRTAGRRGSFTVQLDITGQASQAVTFAADETEKLVPVPVGDDAIVVGDRNLNLGLSNPNGVVLGTPLAATLTVREDDVFRLQFSAATYVVAENAGQVAIEVQRSGGGNGVVSVRLTVSAGSATPGADFTPEVRTLTFGNGELSQTVILPILDDGVVDGSRTVMLLLDNPGGGALVGSIGGAVLTITDNEQPPPPPVPGIRAELARVKVGKKMKLVVRVFFADTGAKKSEFNSPYQKPSHRNITVRVLDTNGDGKADTVMVSAKKGKKTVTRFFAG